MTLECGLNTAFTADASAYVDPLVGELVAVLKAHPRGLRRWSVMRAMRENRKRRSLEVSPRFEVEVERVFRKFSGAPNPTFCRPAETAGEVWALA